MDVYTCSKSEKAFQSLRKTFEFIQQYQVNEKGDIFKTSIVININLIKSQYSNTDEDRVSAYNRVTGIISYVSDTAVIIIADGEFEGKYSEYTLEYSSIIEVDSPAVQSNYELYVKYIRALPSRCLVESDKYEEILRALKNVMKNHKDSGYKGINIIFNGLRSRLITFAEIDYHELEIVGNLIVLGGIYILTPNYIGGLALIPNCESERSNELREENLNVW